jgi:hypothetical protein
MAPPDGLRRWLGAALGPALVAVLAGVLTARADRPATGESRRASPAAPACEQGTLAEVEPAAAISLRFQDRRARIFIEALEGSPLPPESPAAALDGAVVLAGPEVMGGIVAIALRGQCVIGHRFLAALELIHATAMVELHDQRPELASVEHLDAARLQALADAGEPAAEFHAGIVRALGLDVPADRAVSTDWFRRSAARGYGPGMLALGMALAGPGIVEDESRVVGEPRRRDDLTDLPQSCYWLRRAARDADPWVAGQARFVFEAEVAPRMRPEETRGCKTLLQQLREATP